MIYWTEVCRKESTVIPLLYSSQGTIVLAIAKGFLQYGGVVRSRRCLRSEVVSCDVVLTKQFETKQVFVFYFLIFIITIGVLLLVSIFYQLDSLIKT